MTNRIRAVAFISAVTLGTSACQSDPVSLGDLQGDYTMVIELLPDEVVDVDLLFVVDNSGSMAEEQASLAAWAEDALFGVLGTPRGTPLNLHVGVVSTNLGGGASNVTHCGTSDDGALQNSPADELCAAPTDRFLIDVDDGAGGRTTNYSGTLAEAFGCIARLGTESCGFEQPLEAMRLALDGHSATNDGFLREDALLAVVFVSDEDDCSTYDPTFFDLTDLAIGPASSLRCFAQGVICDPDDPLAVGSKENCRVRTDSDYLTDVAEYVEFLHALKAEPGKVVVAAIAGDSSPVAVVPTLNGQGVQLEDVCGGRSEGSAAPAVRLQALLDAFPARNRFATICSDDLSGPLRSIAARVNDTVGRGLCADGPIADADLNQTGIQPSCRAFEVDATDISVRTPLPLCGGSDSRCFSVVEDQAACAHTASHLAINLPSELTAPGHRVQVECLRP